MATWTDNPATTTTHIRARHINELRYVVDQNRSAAGLGFYSWTDYPVTISTHIRADHFTKLRSAIQDLWNHLGMGSLPNWSYGSAPSGSGGRHISARDINDLRNWVDQYQARTGTTVDPPSQFGVDSTNTLDTITWSAFKAWSGYYPSFAGRYFDVSFTWKGGEGQAAKAATGGALAYIAPLQSSFPANQSKTGSAGFSQGQSDANTTCLTILANINSGELAIPGSDTVYIYLDVEAGTNLSVDYWAGWADYVWHYNVNGVEPLYPAMYAHFYSDSDGIFNLDQSLQNVLNQVHTVYPANEVCCFGFWTSQPELCSYCDPNPSITVPQYATYTQPCISSGRAVPMAIWQYAERGSCLGAPCNRPTGIFGGQNVDLDRSFSSPDTSNMLVIK